MYARMFSYKVGIDETTEMVAKKAFQEISGSETQFTLSMFEAAKERNPQLFEWMNDPEMYMAQQGISGDVSAAQFRKYHQTVMSHIDNLEEKISELIGTKRPNQIILDKLKTQFS